MKSLTLRENISKALYRRDDLFTPGVSTGLQTAPERGKTNRSNEDKRDSCSESSDEEDIFESKKLDISATENSNLYQNMPSRQLKSYVSDPDKKKKPIS